MLSTIKKCALFTRSGGAVNNTGRCRSNRIYRQIFTDCVPSERSEFANVNGSRTYLSSVMLACVCIIFTDLALAESFSGSPLGNDYLGLLASIITAFGLIIAALIRRDGDANREADRRAYEKHIAQTLAAKRRERENDNGSGFLLVICAVVILGLIVFYDIDS